MEWRTKKKKEGASTPVLQGKSKRWEKEIEGVHASEELRGSPVLLETLGETHAAVAAARLQPAAEEHAVRGRTAVAEVALGHRVAARVVQVVETVASEST